MLTYDAIMTELKALGNPQTARLYANRGMTLEIYGVKIADLKKIVKVIKKDHDLSLALYASGVYDAMYLAGLIADEHQISKATLQEWVEGAKTYLLSEYTVAWVASETPYALEVALAWIDAPEDLIRAAGWATLTNYVMITEDEAMDGQVLEDLLKRVEMTIHKGQNRERYTMNGFVIGLAAGYKPLLEAAKALAESMGTIKVSMGKTACKVPYAPEYIKKMEARGKIGQKKKRARC